MSAYRTLNAEQFEQQFPDAWEDFCRCSEVGLERPEDCSFRVDIEEDGCTVVWLDGVEFASHLPEENTWIEL